MAARGGGMGEVGQKAQTSSYKTVMGKSRTATAYLRVVWGPEQPAQAAPQCMRLPRAKGESGSRLKRNFCPCIKLPGGTSVRGLAPERLPEITSLDLSMEQDRLLLTKHLLLSSCSDLWKPPRHLSSSLAQDASDTSIPLYL